MLIDYKNATIYQEDKLILDNANFHLDEGEFIYPVSYTHLTLPTKAEV